MRRRVEEGRWGGGAERKRGREVEKTEEKRRGVGEEGRRGGGEEERTRSGKEERRGGKEERSVSVDCGVVVLLRSSSG